MLSQDLPRRVPLAAIHVEPGRNPRRAFRAAAMARLVESIRDQGLIQPPLVRPHPERADEFYLIAGERRLRALREIGAEEVPVLVREVDADQARVLGTLENLDRTDLSPAEEARVARENRDAHDGDSDRALTARTLGRSTTLTRPPPLPQGALRI
jgi:ParB family transcriptional regulator, chromosome partitioning protein